MESKEEINCEKETSIFYGAESAMKLGAFLFLRIHLYIALFAHNNRIIYSEMESTREAKAKKKKVMN